jgi:hypothetical protein
MVAVLAANRIVAAVSGWGSWFAVSWVFDNIMYPAMIAWLGPVLGGLIMTVLAATICYVWLRNIIASDEDWFAMDEIRGIVERILVFPRWLFRQPIFVGLILFALQIGSIVGAEPSLGAMPYDPVVVLALFRQFRTMPYELIEFIIVFVAVSIQSDSMIATLYFREGDGKVLSRRDKQIFLVSTALANTYWTIRSWMVVIIIRYGIEIWQWLQARGWTRVIEVFSRYWEIVTSHNLLDLLLWISENIRSLFLLLIG